MHYIITIIILFFLVFVAIEGKAITRHFMTDQEIRRLVNAAQALDEAYSNPATPVATEFDSGYDSQVWKFHLINGGGLVSDQLDFHAVQLAFSDNGHGWMDIIHRDDPDFERETGDFNEKPAAGQYNNATLIGFQGYQPTPMQDIVMTCALEVSPDFYGTAGCIFQQQGTIGPDGGFPLGSFNQFGIAILGKESRLMGQTGALGYGVTNWYPTTTCSLGDIDVTHPQLYKIILRWVSRTEWEGAVYVNGVEKCRAAIPPLGPVETHIWSDNYLLQDGLLGMYPAVGYQNAGSKYARFHRVAVWAEDR